MKKFLVTLLVVLAASGAAFGQTLIDQPAMTAVIADLQLETEAATWAGLRLARA